LAKVEKRAQTAYGSVYVLVSCPIEEAETLAYAFSARLSEALKDVKEREATRIKIQLEEMLLHFSKLEKDLETKAQETIETLP
jgi:hypothetical protein